jgi:hypothetical protein
MVVELAAFDMWGLFVSYAFGGFWMAVAGLMLLMFVIMGVLGRISIYSCFWYTLMFLLAMTLGYGYVLLNMIIGGLIILGLIFSWYNYIGSNR